MLAEPLPIRARRFRAVFVCGLQEGEFPLPARPEPFLSDERRFELAAGSGLRLGPREDSLARERYLFYAAVSRATERVVLSYRSSDEEGNLALPSPFLADVADVLVGWPARRRRLLADVVWPAEAAPTIGSSSAAGGGAGARGRRRRSRSERWGRRRCRGSATAGSCPPGPWRATATVRCAGWSNASSSPSCWSPNRSRSRAAR